MEWSFILGMVTGAVVVGLFALCSALHDLAFKR